MGKQDWHAEEARWAKQLEAVVGGIRGWRADHPRATFREIAAAIDAELNPLRARLLAETAARSPLAEFTALPDGERPRCARCGGKLIGRGRRKRRGGERGGGGGGVGRADGGRGPRGGGGFPPRRGGGGGGGGG